MREFPQKAWSRAGLDRLLSKIDATGVMERRRGSGRRRSAQMVQNIAMAARKTLHTVTKLHERFNVKPVFLDHQYVVLQNTTYNWGHLNACQFRSWTTTAGLNDFTSIVTAWQQLSQAFLDGSIGEWRRRLESVVQCNGGHIEHVCWIEINNACALDLKSFSIFTHATDLGLYAY